MDNLREASGIILASWGTGLAILAGVVIGLILGLSVPSAAAYAAMALTGKLPFQSFRENVAEIMSTMLGGMIGAYLLMMFGTGILLFVGMTLGPAFLIAGAFMLWGPVLCMYWWHFLKEHMDFGVGTFLLYMFNLNVVFPILLVFFVLVPIAGYVGSRVPPPKASARAAVATPGLGAASVQNPESGEPGSDAAAASAMPRYDVALLIRELNEPIKSLFLPKESRMIIEGEVSKADYTGLYFFDADRPDGVYLLANYRKSLAGVRASPVMQNQFVTLECQLMAVKTLSMEFEDCVPVEEN